MADKNISVVMRTVLKLVALLGVGAIATKVVYGSLWAVTVEKGRSVGMEGIMSRLGRRGCGGACW